MFDWFHKTRPKITKITLPQKKHATSTPVCLTLLFQKKKMRLKKEFEWAERGVVIKSGKWNI